MIRKTDSNSELIWGLLLVAVGALFLLQNFSDLEIFKHIWKFWPVALVIWGVTTIVNRKK